VPQQNNIGEIIVFKQTRKLDAKMCGLYGGPLVPPTFFSDLVSATFYFWFLQLFIF